jgi:hypothetical protein
MQIIAASSTPPIVSDAIVTTGHLDPFEVVAP